MSSATQWGVAEVGQGIRDGNIRPQMDDVQGGPGNFLNRRQQDLDMLWRHYRCSNYDGRKYDWNGGESVGKIETDLIATSGSIPAGFYDGGATMPLKFRKPSTPYYLGKVIPRRFTSLLFSSSKHPQIGSDDPQTEDWLQGFAEASRLWAQMIQARTFGGAMGSVGLGFKFVRGAPHVEVFDPRYCEPNFRNRQTGELESVEIRWQYPLDIRQPDGSFDTAWFWYRRIIDSERDVAWPKVLVDGSEEPRWDEEHHFEEEHELGFCPVVWIQNQPVQDDVDGDPDCHGAYDMIEDIDQLLSQSSKGAKANCDPTLWMASDADFDQIKKGSGHAIQTEKGGSAQFLEMSGSGITVAMALAAQLEERVLLMASCVLDRNDGGPAKTELETATKYSAMCDQADILRLQYEKGLCQLLDMVLIAARQLEQPRQGENADGKIAFIRSAISIPRKRAVGADGSVKYIPRALGRGSQVELRWPSYFATNATNTQVKVQAAGNAHAFGLLDTAHAMAYIAKDFDVENVPAMRAALAQENSSEPAEQLASAMGRTFKR